LKSLEIFIYRELLAGTEERKQQNSIRFADPMSIGWEVLPLSRPLIGAQHPVPHKAWFDSF
jgi:hypothetical protein